MVQKNSKCVFIIGSKGIPARYGGFETFVDELTKRRKDNKINYFVSCMNYDDHKSDFKVNDARCFNIRVPNIGPAKAVLYDILALNRCLDYIRKNNVQQPIIYVLACRIGPFIKHFKTRLQKFNGTLVVNPDGHEWKRAKWNMAIRRYWKLSERLMVKNADLLVCDSLGIEKYIQNDYRKYHPNTTYISYGSYIAKDQNLTADTDLTDWLAKFKLKINEYYLVVGRFVPENNLETILKEFHKSHSTKRLVIISNVENNNFYKLLKESTNFESDDRIKFVGTVYNSKLLLAIRCAAFAYIHGHSVGGTNPSLLEALGSTKLNLLYDVNFNREVGQDGALYWSKKSDDLAQVIDKAEEMTIDSIESYARIAKYRIESDYSWDSIVAQYEKLFQKEL